MRENILRRHVIEREETKAERAVMKMNAGGKRERPKNVRLDTIENDMKAAAGVCRRSRQVEVQDKGTGRPRMVGRNAKEKKKIRIV